VCENLGSPDERVTRAELPELAGMEFAPLNVLILIRRPGVPDRPRDMIGRRLFGNPDELFLQSQPKRGLITSAEVRVLALADMDLGPASIVWDVGAGSGAVGIEAASIAREGTTYAIEMNPEDHQLIASNAERFNVPNLVPILGHAPEAWAELPAPDAIFIGGAGRAVGGIAAAALERLKPGGRMVLNVASIDSLGVLSEFLRSTFDDVRIRMVSIAQGTDQLDALRFEAMNPTYLLSVVKPA
jgi:precorrin-6Y C5,15-methyltransferase (decarboxylating)